MSNPHKQETRIHSITTYILDRATQTNKQTLGVQMRNNATQTPSYFIHLVAEPNKIPSETKRVKKKLTQ